MSQQQPTATARPVTVSTTSKRRLTPVACLACRKRKRKVGFSLSSQSSLPFANIPSFKCDGARPVCAPCSRSDSSTCAYDYEGGQTRYSQIKSRTIELEAEVAHLKALLAEAQSRSPCCHNSVTSGRNDTTIASHTTNDPLPVLPSLSQMFPELPLPAAVHHTRLMLSHSSLSSDGTNSFTQQRTRDSESPPDTSHLIATDPLPLLATAFNNSPRPSTLTSSAKHNVRDSPERMSFRHSPRPLAPYPASSIKLTSEADESPPSRGDEFVSHKRGRDQFVMDAQWHILRGDEDQRSFGRLDLPKANLTGCQEPCNHSQCRAPVRKRKYT